MFNRRKNLFGDLEGLFNELNFFSNQEPMFIKGKTNVETGSDENGMWTKETFTSLDGSYSVTSLVRNYGNTKTTNDSDELSTLKKQLKDCVETQDFEKAAKIRDKIKSMETNKEKISELETKLKKAVDSQDFEKAIELRDEIKKIKM